MSTERAAEVRAVVERRADGTLFFAPRGDCGACDGNCGLARGGVDVPLPTSLAPGESVRLRVSMHGLRRAAIMAFGLPLSGLLAATAIASAVGLTDAGVIVGASCGLIFGLTVSARRSSGFGVEDVAVTILDSESGLVNNGALCGAARRTTPIGLPPNAKSNFE